MNKTKIEWCDYTINPIKGLCRNDCWYCYAKRMYKRFKWDEHIELDPKVFNDVVKLKEPSRIFVGSTHDIFGDWIPHHWICEIIDTCNQYPKHTFIFLTKFPKRYVEFIFNNNCWLGTSITGIENNQSHLWGSFSGMNNIKFISYEPLLGEPDILASYLSRPSWIIVGGLTPKPMHKNWWVEQLMNEFKNTPIFLKDNLKWHKKIQEFPEVII